MYFYHDRERVRAFLESNPDIAWIVVDNITNIEIEDTIEDLENDCDWPELIQPSLDAQLDAKEHYFYAQKLSDELNMAFS